jgi:NAD(P)-dependent dehydrogenase (short-subunit alcohol dehydrogenase family)
MHVQVNLLGSVYPTRAVIAGMKKKGAGRIVFVASQVAQVRRMKRYWPLLQLFEECGLLA